MRFHPVAAVGKLAHKAESNYTLWGETVHKRIQKTQNTQSRKQNIQNKETNIKRIIIKKSYRVIKKSMCT